MNILDYGSIILLKNITFEDGKYDLEGGHPGIVLLPTNETQEEAFCLYMTSDKNRAKKEEYKYAECKSKTLKQSFINIQQIVETKNIRTDGLAKLPEREFHDLLEKFYQYQMTLEEANPKFLKIKKKIEILIELLKTNEKMELTDFNITRDQIDFLEQVENIEKGKRIFAFVLAKNTNVSIEDINKKYLLNDKNKKIFEKLLEISDRIDKINLNDINIHDPNNELREIYLDVKVKNYLLNADMLFEDLVSALKLSNQNKNKIEILQKFNKLEKERELRKKQKLNNRIEKNKNRYVDNKNKKEKAKSKRRNKKLKKKYGKFDFEIYNG